MATPNRFAAARTAAPKKPAAQAAPAEAEAAEPIREAEPPAPSKPRKKPSAARRPAAAKAPRKATKADQPDKEEKTLYGFMLTSAQNKALNRLKGIDDLDRSYVVRQALDEWFASHAGEHPEALGQYGK